MSFFEKEGKVIAGILKVPDNTGLCGLDLVGMLAADCMAGLLSVAVCDLVGI